MQQREVSRQSVDLQDDPELLSPPLVKQPYRCATKVQVTGFVPRAEIDVEVNSTITTERADFPWPDGVLIELPDPLEANQQLRVRQRTSTGQSRWSDRVIVRDHLEDYPAGPPRPQISPAPVYECGSRTGVANLLVGGNVWITADRDERGRVEGCSEHQGVNVNPDYGIDEEVRAWFELCEDPSPPSERYTTQTYSVPLVEPGFDPIRESGERLTITNIVNGARVTLFRNDVDEGTSRCWGYKLRWGLSTPITPGDRFRPNQRMCPRDPAGEGTETGVEPCENLPAPLVGPVQYGDDRITLVEFEADAVIKVYINLNKVAEGAGPVILLSQSIAYGDVIHVEQILGDCRGQTVREVIPDCVDPPVSYDPSSVDLFPVGHREYAEGDVRGSVYYPANDDGEGEPFNERLAALGRVPIVFLVHGNHPTHYEPGNRLNEWFRDCGTDPDPPADWLPVPNHRGYVYFQQQLAKMGIIAVSVDCNAHNCSGGDWTNIALRADLVLDSIEYFQRLDADAGSIFHQRIDFDGVGLMGHSRGGDTVVYVPEINSLPGVNIRSVIALAPTSFGPSSGRPRGYAFMTILPAGDGDVWSNDGAKFYDQAQPEPFKCQLYVHHTNHNFFNREWLYDDHHGPTVMPRQDHERVLSVYGCAFFRNTLLDHDTVHFLSGQMIPAGVAAENVHISFEQQNALAVDHHEDRNGIDQNSMSMPTSQHGGMAADEYPFRDAGSAFNSSFFGNSVGMVAEDRELNGIFRSQLRTPTDLGGSEIWLRVAEVYNGTNIPPENSGFELGLEDEEGVVVWFDSDRVGNLPRPYHRRADDLATWWIGRDGTKTMLKTLRFRGSCYTAANPDLHIENVVAILIRTNRGDQRALAFDDLQIVNYS